jgi:hypothetical protein
MADSKVSGLASLAAADVAPATDVINIVDTSVATSKKITVNALGQSMNVLATEQASTSGTFIDFTGIPAGVKRIEINFVGVSISGTDTLVVQLGDAGGPETSGYLGAGSNYTNGALPNVANFTTGFGFATLPAASVMHGSIFLRLEEAADFTWTANGTLALSNAGTMAHTAGSKSLSAELTQVRITTSGGSDTFDAGVINISYT